MNEDMNTYPRERSLTGSVMKLKTKPTEFYSRLWLCSILPHKFI